MGDCWMSIPICLHVHLCLSDGPLSPFSPEQRQSISHTHNWMLTYTQTRTHAYISTRRTGHLAPAAARLMQNTTRLGRWQLHQEVGPQQAKCAHRSCPDARWSGGQRRLAGCEPREGWSWVERRKLVKGEKWCPFNLGWRFALWSFNLSCFFFVVFWELCSLTLLSVGLALLLRSCPVGQLLSAQSHLEHQVVSF